MTRKGKIARLPRHIRQTLNRRLDDGEQATDLVLWLNTLDEVKKILNCDFDGRPINEQNVSEWKKGGFLEGQREQETFERVRRLVDFSDDLDDAADEQSIPNRLAAVLAAELAAETLKILEEETDPNQRLRRISETMGHLRDIRSGNHASDRLRIEMERWEIERNQHERDNAIDEARDHAKAPIWAALERPTVVAAFGGGEQGEKIADFLNEIDRKASEARCDWPGIPRRAFAVSPPDQTEIKPAQAKSK
jgi:hypothetical protein